MAVGFMSLDDVFEGLSVFKSVGSDTWQILGSSCTAQVGFKPRYKWHHITIWILHRNKVFVIDAKITRNLYGLKDFNVW